MKNIFSICLLSILLAACASETKKEQETFEDFKENHYNFKWTKEIGYGKIKFKLPQVFENSLATHFTITSNAKTLQSLAIPIYFSVERFSEKDKQRSFVRDYVVQENLLNTFHDAYIYKRYNSLYQGSISIKKEVRKNVKFPGVIQVVAGESDYSDNSYLYYATATLQVKKEYYIFQFIADAELMAYVYDDFERILASVKQIK